MKPIPLWNAVAAVFLWALAASQGQAQDFTSAELQARMVERRAVDAVVWGVPAVNLDMMRQAYFRDAKAKYNDIIWWPKGGSWKNQSLAVNTEVRYLYVFANTRDNGPVVLELPPGGADAGFYGTIMDAWQVPLTDIGEGGKGGKFLILPPGHTGDIPAGYTALPAKTYNSYALIRSIIASNSAGDVAKGDALVKQIKVYPLSMADKPPEQKFLDMTDTVYNAVIPYDASFFTSLARMIEEEPVQPQDLQMLGMLLQLGIEKGKPFAPDAATKTALNTAAREAHAWLLDGIVRTPEPWWPKSKWAIPSAPNGSTTSFLWQLANYFDVDGRGITLADWFGPVSKLGGSSFYLSTYLDHDGAPLNGDNSYVLHVPAKVPAKQFWSVTAYDMSTSTLFRDATRLAVASLDQGVVKNADGSVDVYFGQKAPEGKDSNWIFTAQGKDWFPWFRFYGPDKAILDKSWTMPDITKTP